MITTLIAGLLQASGVTAAPAASFVIACQESGGDTMWFAAAPFNSTRRTFYDGPGSIRFTISTFTEGAVEGSVTLTTLIGAGPAETARSILPYDSSTIIGRRLVISVHGTSAPVHVCIRSR